MANYLQYFDFLEGEENLKLFEKVKENQEAFDKAGVIDYSGDYPEWRSAKVNFSNHLENFKLLLKEKIAEKYQPVCEVLNIAPLKQYETDIQLTVHNDGDYFKVHSDCGTEETSNRVLTFVYYFHKNPKMFSGGELVLYCPEKILVEPENNMIIFFNPQLLHEVQIVSCKDNAFENGRFTLNGWILNNT